MIITGTGPRSLQIAPAKVKHDVYQRLTDALAQYRPQAVISGMAEGFDNALANAALGLGIPLWCIIPNHGYANYYWRDHSLTGKNQLPAFERILMQADDVTFVCDATYVDGRHSNFIRNDKMLKLADAVLIWWAQSPGTQDAIRTIQSKGMPHTILNPEHMPGA